MFQLWEWNTKAHPFVRLSLSYIKGYLT